MYDRNKFLAGNAQSALENNRKAQEERKKTMFREQKTIELKKLETQLFYKQQEVERLKSLFERLRRETVHRKTGEQKEKQELLSQERQLKDAEGRIKQLETDVARSLADIGDKISKEKAALLEHQRNLETLEKQKREIEGKKDLNKRTVMESISRILFFKKKEEHEVKHAQDVLHSGQVQMRQIEQSLKTFTQETTVLENKIRALRTALK